LTLSWTEIVKAFERLESKKTIGKTVLTVEH
jgi:hypothetical protein